MTFHEYIRKPERPRAVDEDDMPNFDRDIGEHGARLDMIEKDLSSIKVDVREIRDALVSAKGGWKMLMAAGALAGAVGSFVITKILPFLSGAPK